MFEEKMWEYLVNLILDEKITERVFELRCSALFELNAIISVYKNRHFLDELLKRIFEKKAEFIMEAETKEELKQILEPSIPIYCGGKFSSDSTFHVEEEELLLWSMASLKGPLISEGTKRYEELFCRILPEKAKFIFPQPEEDSYEERTA